MIRIGYQGEIGSNSEAAAHEFIKNNGWNKNEYKLIPLVESMYVIDGLKSGRIDYGVVATNNSIAGIGKETYEATKGEHFKLVDTIILPIHHCLFVKKGIDISKVKYVTSHIQALEQTRINRNRFYPEWKEVETNDTASAARNLSEGVFSDDYAVVCRKNAGEYYDLQLVHENIEDLCNNKTEFHVYKNTTMG